jgi:hypothetical protein
VNADGQIIGSRAAPSRSSRRERDQYATYGSDDLDAGKPRVRGILGQIGRRSRRASCFAWNKLVAVVGASEISWPRGRG